MKEKYLCPCCGEDISEFVHQEITQYNKRRVAEKMRQSITPERRAEMNEASRKRLKEWAENNPEQMRANAAKASKSRTAESFARQRESIKSTSRRKVLKFAELLFEEQKKGTVITPDVENALMQKAKEIVKEENKSRKKRAKNG